jgi:hypothetical protein
MPTVYPEGTPTLGNTSVVGILTVANQAAPKLATEINAVTSVDVSCYLYPAGWSPTATPAKGTKPARLCSKKTQEQFNRTAYAIGDLQYVHDPQAADSADGNEARELLQEGTQLHLLERQGLDAEDTAFAVGQHTIDHYVVLGPQIRSGDRTDENGEFFITQSVIYVGDGPVEGIVAT